VAGDMILIAPPLTINEMQTQELIQILADAIGASQEQLKQNIN
jgi:adenosylmethionine-8-amino-7-oxononanoate aminotransferase